MRVHRSLFNTNAPYHIGCVISYKHGAISQKLKFPFRVLIDKKDPVTAVNKMMMDYKVPGLPTKIILDPNGNIRFRSIGFSFGDDAIVEELSAMIELARKG